MYEKFKDVAWDGLLFLLEDCLLRIQYNNDNPFYVLTQVKRAKEIQEEMKFRTGEITVVQ